MGTNLDKQIGARLKHLRIKAGYTQAQLAEKVGCETSTIAHCEIGKNRISLTLLDNIANVLKVEIYKFFISHEPEKKLKYINSSSRMNLKQMKKPLNQSMNYLKR